MNDKLIEEIKLRKIREMKNPAILLNKDDYEELKKELGTTNDKLFIDKHICVFKDNFNMVERGLIFIFEYINLNMLDLIKPDKNE